MYIDVIKFKKQVTKLYKVKVTIRSKIYWLHFEVTNGKFPEFKSVSTADLTYFNFSDRTRKKHFKQITEFLSPKK